MKAVRTLLLDMGITPDIEGFDHLCTAVALVLSNKNEYRHITKSLYPDIAKANASTPTRVERNIRHAISKAIVLDHGEMKNLIGLDPYKNKVCNSEFIFSLAYAVNQEENK